MTSKQVTLARCLFEAIDDISFSNVVVLLEKHGADPNTIIPKLEIAPIHYAVGFDNLDFSEKVTTIFLKKKANPNLLTECDGLSPLHIACIWGRPKIVQQLLDHGACLDLKCKENQTPIMYAIQENHFEVIEVIQKFIFEQKMDRKKKELILKSKCQDPGSSSVSRSEESFSTPIRNHHLKNALQNLEEKKFTPNRINYNFDASSPYYINITHRRHKTSRENSLALDDSRSSSRDANCKRNLFDLTEKNLKEFSQTMDKVIVIDRLAIHKRRSYIKDWREKIQQIRNSDKTLDISYINYLNSCNDVTLMNDPDPEPEIVIEISDESEKEENKSSSDSFTTAKSDLQRFDHAIRNLPEPCQFIEHLEEDYIHSDKETGVILYERKLISKSRLDLASIDETDLDVTKSHMSVSTEVSLPPLDYDTDTLRAEIRNLTGGNPGPITKNTKRLYLKQLVKLKKRPDLALAKRDIQKAYSPELQRTITNYGQFEQNLVDFLKLETQMSNHFLENGHIKWREGNIKTSFIYLLIDPRLSDNLPLQYKDMSKADIWAKFLSSIFYVGKGKRSRPYSHLYDAIKLFSVENNQVAERLENRRNQIIEKRVLYSDSNSKNELTDERGAKAVSKQALNRYQDSKKLQKIVDIWKSQMGVVCLHIFNSIIPCEAYTREAAIIDAIEFTNLTNLKRGDYYGGARTFSMRQKKQMGVALLHRAMNIYLAEGESQLMPFDLI